MKMKFWISAGIVALTLLGMCYAAKAHHKKGHDVFVKDQVGRAEVVICDTQEQAESILKASLENGHQAGIDKFRELYIARNSRNEHVCLVQAIALFMKEQVSVFDGVPFDSGTDSKTIYVIRGSIRDMSYYFLSLWPLVPAGEDI
mgnify:CR=1 FL=1